jgi:hypothetical protein
MGLIRWSIAGLMAIVLFVALAFASIINASPLEALTKLVGAAWNLRRL